MTKITPSPDALAALKPCPFCGEEYRGDSLVFAACGGEGQEMLKVQCSICGAAGPPDGIGPWHEEIGPAAAQWNRRAPSPALAKLDAVIADIARHVDHSLEANWLITFDVPRDWLAALRAVREELA